MLMLEKGIELIKNPPLVPSLLNTFQNRPFIKLIPCWVLDQLVQTIIATLMIYYVRYVIVPEYQPQCFGGTSGKWYCDSVKVMGAAVLVILMAAVVGTPIFMALAQRYGKRTAWLIWSATSAFTNILMLIPGEGDYAFLSSGTWSILGTELPTPILTEEAFNIGWANEQGVDNTTRFLRNISGAWLFQECERQWSLEGDESSYAERNLQTEAAAPFLALVDPDHDDLKTPGRMPERIQQLCRDTGQAIPQTKGEILRVVVESVALKHRVRFDQLRHLTGKKLERIHMGGGVINNELLVQSISTSCGVPVHAGPAEATACGNLITQMVATGDLPDIAAGRQLVRDSIPLKIFEPRDSTQWNQALARFEKLLS